MDIKLAKNDKRYIEGSDDVFSIMQRVLLRENKIDKEKEHFWIIGMNEAGYIPLYRINCFRFSKGR